MLDRRAMRQACATTLMQDIRKAKLLIRFKTSYRRRETKVLDTRRGVLGQIKVKEGGAINLRNATMQCMRQFAQPCFHAPKSSIQKTTFRFDKRSFKRLKKSIHYYCADAASKEQLAGAPWCTSN